MSVEVDRSDDRTDALMRALGDTVLEVTPAGMLVDAWGLVDRHLRPREQVIGRSLREVLPSEAANAIMSAVDGVTRDGAARSIEYMMPRETGPRAYEARIAPGSIGNFYVIVRDVHVRRTAEQQIRESEARFRLMADHAPVMLWKSGRNAECDFFNKGWLEFTGRTLEKELGVGWAGSVHPEDFQSCMEVYMTAFVDRRPFRMEYRLRRSDAAYRWVLDQGAPRFAPDGTFEGFIGSCVDITDSKESADQIHRLNAELQERLKEREVLLREIHHRVKNNLQVISSILSLQSHLVEGHARTVLQEGQTRIHSIALVHEKLYGSESLADVDLSGYARDLIGIVFQAIGAPQSVSIQFEAEELRLGVDQAVPCGMLINELLTNALEHAFPDGRKGTVRVEIRRLGADRAMLEVADDGVGLPGGIEPERPKTLGLDLVAALARQLGAETEVQREGGVRYRFTFKVSSSSGR